MEIDLENFLSNFKGKKIFYITIYIFSYLN